MHVCVGAKKRELVDTNILYMYVRTPVAKQSFSCLHVLCHVVHRHLYRIIGHLRGFKL